MTNATAGSIVAKTCGGGELEDPAPDDDVDAPEECRKEMILEEAV